MTDQSILEDCGLSNQRAERAAFRPIHYLGSKRRLLDAIVEELDLLNPTRGRAVDLFSGSGVVAAHLAEHRDVVAVDIQEYARVLASALLSPAQLADEEIHGLLRTAHEMQAELLRTAWSALISHEQRCIAALRGGDPEPMAQLLERGSLATLESAEFDGGGPLADAQRVLLRTPPREPQTTLTQVYGGVYFGYRQALQLDCLLAATRVLPAGAVDTCLAAVMSAASECVTSVGNHFAQPLRPRNQEGQPKTRALIGAASRRELDVYAVFEQRLRRFARLPPPGTRTVAVRADYRDFLSSYDGEPAVIYADPPYTRDHYSRFYHVLETIALGDSPGVSTVRVGGRTMASRGLYRPGRHQSPFCIKSEAPSAFSALFAGARRFQVPLLLSYSPYASGTAARPQPRLLTVPDIVDLALAEFGEVTVRPAGRVSHSKLNAAHLNGEAMQEAEVFIVCEP